MTPRFGIPALALFAAAVGWAVYPPAPPADPDLTDLAVRQLRDDGTVAPALAAGHRARGTWELLPPVAFLALTAAAVAAGVRDAGRPRRVGA